MDARRLLRMLIGGVMCLVIANITLIVIFVMYENFLVRQFPPYLGAPLLLVLFTEVVVLTLTGLILLVWALVAGIAGPPATAHDPEPYRSGKTAAVRRRERAASPLSAPVTPTALVDPDSGYVSHQDDDERGYVHRAPDPVKRRPDHS